MTRRRDVTLPALLLLSMTVYGFLLVWAQNDTIELTTTIGEHETPMSPAGFSIMTGGNVSIELAPWHSTRTAPTVTTPAHDATGNMDSSPTAATGSDGATIPHQVVSTHKSGARGSQTITHTPRISLGTTGNANKIPRSIKSSKAVTNSTGRVSIKVKIQSSAPKDEATEKFLHKACEVFKTLQLDGVVMTLGPLRTPIVCLPPNKN